MDYWLVMCDMVGLELGSFAVGFRVVYWENDGKSFGILCGMAVIGNWTPRSIVSIDFA